MLVYTTLLCSLIAFAASQYSKSSRDAQIVNEARYLAANGQFGATFKQDDGVEFKEEADDLGNRKGSYSYVDPSGQRRTVTYTAGKDGFKASGDHLPSPVAPVSAPAANPSYSAAPSAPSYSSGSYSSGQARSSNGPALDSGFYNPDFDYPDDGGKSYESGQYVPESQSYSAPQSYNAPRAQSSVAALYKPASPQSSYSASQFQIPSDFGQYNSEAPSYRASYNQYSTQAPQYQASYNQYSSEAPAAYQSYNQINSDSGSYRSPQSSYPGKLSVNRSPDGFSYTFKTS